MSTAFSITGTNFYQIAKLEELRLGYSERRNMLGDSYQKWTGSAWASGAGTSADTLASTEPAAGHNIQHRDFYYDMQDYFKTNVGGVARPYVSSEPYSLTAPEYEEVGPYYVPLLSFSAYTTDAWLKFCTMVGGDLYTSDTDFGFRRVASLDTNGDPVFSRGTMQDEDYIGPWIFEDLVSVMENFIAIEHNHTPIDITRYTKLWQDGGTPYVNTSTTDDENYPWAVAEYRKYTSYVRTGRQNTSYPVTIPSGIDISVDSRRAYFLRHDPAGPGDWMPEEFDVGDTTDVTIPDDDEMIAVAITSSEDPLVFGFDTDLTSYIPDTPNVKNEIHMECKILLTFDFTNA